MTTQSPADGAVFNLRPSGCPVHTIESSITSLGERVVDDLRDYGHVNRVYIVGGGAPLIEAAVIKAWQRLGSKVVMMASPQTALVEAIALFKGE